jgi:hypothetical protein
MRILKIVFFATVIFFVSSCSDSCKDFSRKVNVILKEDNKVTSSELANLVGFVNENQKELKDCYSNLFEDGALQEKNLCEEILTIAAKRRGATETPQIDGCKGGYEIPKVKPNIKVFIENSGSMHGYVEGNTTFEAAIGNLLVKVKHRYDKENIHLNFVNTEVTAINKEIAEFVQQLEPATMIVDGKVVLSSNLSQIFKLILNNTESGIGDNDIGIFVSDCIYSIDGTNTEGLLANQKNLTMDAFLEKFKKTTNHKLSTIMMKMTSNFTGVYYMEKKTDKNAKNWKWLRDKERPYYIWVMGKTELINDFYKNIPLKTLDGYKQMYMLSDTDETSNPCKTFLTTTNRVGKFRKDRKSTFALTEVAASTREGQNDGVFQFAIALNLDADSYGVEESFLTNKDNYSLEALDPFSITIHHKDSIDINSKENPKCDLFTHIVTFRTEKLKKKEQTITLHLNKKKAKTPSWVVETNVINDRDINNQSDKTFGFSYLVEGVTEAYKTNYSEDNYYFKISISLKQ